MTGGRVLVTVFVAVPEVTVTVLVSGIISLGG
jgi:hypothetical protein